jgi:hypothetical protein
LLPRDEASVGGWWVLDTAALEPLWAAASEASAEQPERVAFFAAARRWLGSLRALAQRLRADAAGDARPWREPLRALDLLWTFERRTLLAVADVVIDQLAVHGWPVLGAEAARRQPAPHRRLVAGLHGESRRPAQDLAVVDPSAGFAYGLRLQAGRVALVAEAFELGRHGIGGGGSLARRNDLLHALAAELGVGRDAIAEAPGAPSRSLPLGRFDLLLAASRGELIERCIETMWVLWERTAAGRLQVPIDRGSAP